eukprot:7225981-Pyramimonas_sp.AAC.1
MAFLWAAGMEATFSTRTSIFRSGRRLLAKYQAVGTAKKQHDFAPARPSYPPNCPAADRLLHGGPATMSSVLPCSRES